MRSPFHPTFLALALLAGAPHLSAQASAATSAAIRADVVNGLRIVKVADVDFGVVPAGSGPTTLPATDPGAGQMNLSGQNGRTVTVIISAPPALTSGANALPFLGAASVNESADDPAAAVPAPVGPSFTMKLRDQGPSKNARAGYLYLHGVLTVGPSAVPGLYTGIVTVRAEQ